MGEVINIEDRLKARIDRERVVKQYKNEISDWCGHSLAIDLTATKTGKTVQEVLAIINAAGNLWS